MILKTLPMDIGKEKKKKDIKIDANQFNQFLGLKCPKCGEEISLEILVNFFQKSKSK